MTGLLSLKTLRDARRGFTLIEIMIAVAIVSVMAAIFYPMAQNYFNRANVQAARLEIRNIKMAVEAYRMDTGVYPARLRDLIKRPTGDEEIASKWTSPYLPKKDVPRDPWGLPYHYRPTEGGKYPYELYSYGPKGKSGPKIERIDAHKLD